jgi:hypothetical protein
MISSADMVLWVYDTVLSVFVAFVIIIRGQFRRFSVLATYFAIVAPVSLLRMHVLYAYGLASSEYAYFYYFSDLLLCVFLYFAVVTLYRKVFPAKKSHLRVRVGSVLIAAGVGILSLAIVQATSGRLIPPWFVVYSQDLYPVSAVAALVLFGFAARKPNVPKPVHQLAFVFAGYYLVLTLMYTIRYFSRRWGVPLGGLVGFFEMWLPLGVAYVFCDPNINESLDNPYPPL